MRAPACLIAALSIALLCSAAASASAQTESHHEPQQTSAEAPPQQNGTEAAPKADDERTEPVFWISSVEVLRSTHGPQLDVVRVRGLVAIDGWESAELIPLTKGKPVDGFLDLAMVARPPTENITLEKYGNIEAVFVLEPGHPFQGVRVHGASNRVVLKAVPGYVEAAAPPELCSACTGKYFVPKGEAVPTGRKAETVVHEETLPHNHRVLRDSEGLGSLDSDPNRMTLLVDDSGQIIAVMWN